MEVEVDSGIYKILIIDTIEGFKSLESEWNKLLKKSFQASNPFLTFEWQFTWWVHRGKDRDLHIIIVCDSEDNLIGIAPFMIMSRYFFRVVEFIGFENSDYSEVISFKDKGEVVLHCIFHYHNIKKHIWDNISFLYINNRNDVLEHILTTSKKYPIFISTQFYTISPYLPIESSWNDFLHSKSSSFRRNLKYWRTKVTEYGDVEVKCLKAEEITPEVFAHISIIEEKSWKFKNGTGILNKNHWNKFYYDVFKNLSKRNMAEIWLLSIDSVPVAYQLNIVFERKVFFLLGSFNSQYKNIGSFLTSEIIKNAFDRGLIEYDFLGGTEGYKMKWASLKADLFHIVIFKKSFYSILVFIVVFKLKWMLEKIELYHKLISIGKKFVLKVRMLKEQFILLSL